MRKGENVMNPERRGVTGTRGDNPTVRSEGNSRRKSAAFGGHSWLHSPQDINQQLTLDPAYGHITSPGSASMNLEAVYMQQSPQDRQDSEIVPISSYTGHQDVLAQEPEYEQSSTFPMGREHSERAWLGERIQLGERIHKDRYTPEDMERLETEFREKIELLKSERGEDDESTIETKKDGYLLISSIKSKAEAIARAEKLQRETDESLANAMKMPLDTYYQEYRKTPIKMGFQESKERRKKSFMKVLQTIKQN
jgi:hypothetical protein